MTDEISYFEAASFLAEIEPVDIDDPTERIEWLVARLQERWPALTTEQAVAYVTVFDSS